MSLTLHGYWRSSATYRVRIALNLKGIPYQIAPVDLRAGEQHAPEYRALNPFGLAPVLNADDVIMTQSPAILEWLEERHPNPPLLPERLSDRAVVRAMSSMIACDIQPINNVRVLAQLRAQFGADATAEQAWIVRWITEGLAALEPLIRRFGRGFAFGEHPSLADCHLVPQIYSAQRFNVDLSPYCACLAAWEAMSALPAVEAAHPDLQPDAPR